MAANLPPVPREPIGNTFVWRDWFTKIQAFITGGIPGLGTVTSITAGTGLTGGTITNTGTITLATTIAAGGPTGGAATVPVITYNAEGQLVTVTTASITPAAIGAPSGSGTSTGSNTGDNVYSLPIATSVVLGGVKPDGTTITNTAGAISITYPLTSAPGTAAYTAATAYDVSGAAAAVTPTTLGLVIGTNTQAHGAKLDSIQALANAAGWLHNDGAGAFAYSTPITTLDPGLIAFMMANG
jgi:hypothetical protein